MPMNRGNAARCSWPIVTRTAGGCGGLYNRKKRMEKRRNVAILIFDDVEVLDFCGPFEVFSTTGQRQGPGAFQVYTVAEKSGPITARGGLSVNPAYTLADCPPPDILLVPGGFGTRREMHNAALTDWIKTVSESAELVLSVC